MANLDRIYDLDHRVDAIANHQNGILVCLAGPGTGKTYSFLQRIKILTSKLGVDSNTICYFTFIREIAKSFAADFEEEERSVDEPFSPRISTLHSFACRLIRNQGFRSGFNGPLYFTSIAEKKNDESKVFLSDLLLLVKTNQLKSIVDLRKVLEKVKKAWRDNVDPNSLGDSVPTVLSSSLELSRAYRLIDWDQAVPFAHALFQSLDQPPGWIARIEHFLVDEYQDFNQAEQVFINTLATTAKSMVIVGDDDQSLYSGRGGLPHGLRELYNSDNVDKISLVRCHRCKSEILKAANTFLATMRSDPRQMSPKYLGGSLTYQPFKSKKAEVEYLAEFLKTCIAALPERPTRKDGIVCLFPTWKVLNSYMACLSKAGVPSYSRETPSHPKRTWLEQALALVCNPQQRFVERLLLEDFNDIKLRHKRAMVGLVLERDISPVEALDILASEKTLSGPAVSAVQAFGSLCRALSSRDAALIADKLSNRIGMDISGLPEQVAMFIEQLDQSEQEDAISNLCDTLVPESATQPEDPCSILCLTIHGSKGLTKRTVVMPGLEDAWLPGNASENDMHEKKRLFYVAITRATHQVLITYPETRPRGDPLSYPAPGRSQPSRFISQTGIRLMDASLR